MENRRDGLNIRKDVVMGNNELRDLFEAHFEYFVWDQEKVFISKSQTGGAIVYVKEKRNNFFSVFKNKHNFSNKWFATHGNFPDDVEFVGYRLKGLKNKFKKNLSIGQTIIKFDLDWLTTVNKMTKHEEKLFNHNGFAKVTKLVRDDETQEITELGIGFGYQIMGAL